MKFIASREDLLGPLQFVCGVLEKRQTTPILSHLLLVAKDNELVMTGTDQEMQLTTRLSDIDIHEPGKATIPGRKFMDICLNLPEKAKITAAPDDKMMRLEWNQFHARLVTMSVPDFPKIKADKYEVSLTLSGNTLSRMLRATSFAMGQQDVRYFYNGLLLDIKDTRVRLVATNGYRLATSHTDYDSAPGNRPAIIPRKAVAELLRLVSDAGDSEVDLKLSANQMQVDCGPTRLITNLIDATYPDYTRAIPSGKDRVIVVDRKMLRTALVRIAVLSNEINRTVRLSFTPGKLEIYAENSLQEEAEETLEIDYKGTDMMMQFNVNYLIDTLSVVAGDRITWTIRDLARACLLEDAADPQTLFLITPIK